MRILSELSALDFSIPDNVVGCAEERRASHKRCASYRQHILRLT